jgi:NADPH-dependent curcumin reductase CurA
MKSRQMLLASRPHGHPMVVNFKTEEKELPGLKTGEVLLKSLIISVDASMRDRMNETYSQFTPFTLDEPIEGGIVATVVESKNKILKPGDIVSGNLPWATFNAAKADTLRKIDAEAAPVGYYLGVLGIPGLAAYFGLMDIGKPKAGETVVVSAAAGAVGIIVGQLAKMKGCRVVGIAGSNEKCRLLKEQFGFDEVINYKTTQALDRTIAVSCPGGVDIYFDNVGGQISDAVFTSLNLHARVILCGQISEYNITKLTTGPRLLPRLFSRSVLVQGFMTKQYSDRFPEAYQQLALWLKEGKLKYQETITEGFNKLPEAFLGLFNGQNMGKMLVRIDQN